MGSEENLIKAAVKRGFRQNKVSRIEVRTDKEWMFAEVMLGPTLVRIECDRGLAEAFGSVEKFFFQEAQSYDVAITRDKAAKERRSKRKNSDKSFEWWNKEK